MPVITEHIKWRKPRNKLTNPISETESSQQISSTTIQSSINCKSTISSFLSTFSNNTTSNETTHSNNNNNNNNNRNKKNNNFSAASTLRGLGCTAGATQEVSVPAVIRSSADWEGKKNRKKKHRKNKNNKSVVVDDVPFNDVWCGPGIGFSTDAAVVESVDCVVARKNLSSRGKFDGERITHRESSSYFGRRTINTESLSFLNDDDDEEDDSDVFTTRSGRLECFGNTRFYRHASHPSSHDGLSEIMIIQGRRIMGGRFNSRDQFRDWRLDVDNMSYEQLLELGERIGYVNTGLKEDEMRHNIRKIKLLISNETSKHQIDDKECSICQEEYELDDELGRLRCEHSYHFQCIKQWLVLKNFCPVCKQQVVARHT